MPEYIEREALLEDLKLLAKHQQGERQQGILGVCVTIQNRPTADVVEVVRCKDCEHSHWEQEPCHGKTEYYCPKLESKVNSHFYCALGSKKEGIKK